MNMELQQYNILNKTKTIALYTLKFWQKVCFIIIDMYVKYFIRIRQRPIPITAFRNIQNRRIEMELRIGIYKAIF
jgi:hypothetical protein